MRNQPRTGYSLVEFLFTIAILGMIAAIVMPSFAAARRRTSVRAAAAELRSIFHLARSRAISQGSNAGVKFLRTGGEWQFALYDDGDGDGVLNEDIVSGVDTLFTEPRPVMPQGHIAAIALPPMQITDPDGERLPIGASPVVFNRSQLCSFSPNGGSTPGTIYLTAGNDVWAVRVYGTTAKIRVLRYNTSTRRWSER